MRPIDPSPYAGAVAASATSTDMGPAPMLQWVSIALLRVDPRYQREISSEGRRTVVSIATHFAWRKFAPVVVAPIEGGLYAVIDGQRRTTAAALRGIEQVPCLVVIADLAQQADAFAGVNGAVTRLSSLAIYHARVAAGDAAALELQRICADADVTVLRYPVLATKLKRGETIAPNVLLAALARHGAATLLRALLCITWTAEGNPGCICKPVIEALCTVLAAAPRWSDVNGELLDAMDDFAFAAELTEARIAQHREGAPVARTLARRITDYLTAKIGPAEAEA